MKIKINPEALRTVIQALHSLYATDCPVFYSVDDGYMRLESVGGTHRFNISFAVESSDILPLQKTTVGILTRYLALLSDYADMAVKDVFITDETGTMTTLQVTKYLKETNEECLTLKKTLIVSLISETERESVVKNRDMYVGERLYVCPASIGVAASKAHILHAESLYLKGKYVYCTSGDGICRIDTPELDESIEQTIDATFAFNLTKLGAEQYDFYDDYVACEVSGVLFKLGLPCKATVRPMSEGVLALYDTIQPEVRVYCKEIRTLHGKGVLHIQTDNRILLADGKTKIGAPFVLPLKATIQAVSVSDAVTKAAGDVWTVGVATYSGRSVGLVTGDCSIIFNA